MPDLRTWPRPDRLRRIVVVAFVATFALFVFFQWHDHLLSPYTIVSLELAWTPEQAAPMLAAWGAAGQQVAHESLVVDFAFMPAYAFLFAGVTLVVARGAPGRLGGMQINWQAIGLWLVAAPFLAWACDIAENLALFQVLAAPQAPPPAALQVAGWASSTKFELLILCFAYVLAVLLFRRRG
jgi:hypothetical protein